VGPGLAGAIHRREITYPDGPIVHELEAFQYEYTATGVDTEVGNDRLTRREQDVLRFYVSVHDAVGMGVVQCSRTFTGNLKRVRHRQLWFSLEAPAQRLALDIRHGVVERRLRGRLECRGR
jgi:hypothetical protein